MRWWICLILFAVASLTSFSQPLTFLPLTKLETKDGLSSPNIRKIVQDKFGFMWFATQDGLNRFDGARFVPFTNVATGPMSGILGSDVYDLATEGNNLWCLTAYGGLSRIDVRTGTVAATYPLKAHPVTGAKLWFKTMSHRNGMLYIGTDEGYFLKFSIATGSADIYSLPVGSDSLRQIDKLYADAYGKVWLMVSGNGVLVTDTALKKMQQKVRWPGSPRQVKDFALVRDTLLICTSGGLTAFDLRRGIPVSGDPHFPGIPAEVLERSLSSISIAGPHILLSGSGVLYAIDRKSGITRQIAYSRYYDDREWLALTSSIYQSGSSIWIGSQYGVGWIRNRNTPFTGFSQSFDGSGVRIDHATTLCAPTDSTLIACADNGLYFCNHVTGTIRKFSRPDYYFHAFEAPDGHIIASGVNNGLQVADRQGQPLSLQQYYPELVPVRNDLLISSARLDDSLYFLATQDKKGIYVWNSRRHKLAVLDTRSHPVALKSNVINRLYVDSRKRVWIVGDNVVSVYDVAAGRINHLDLIRPENKEPISINMDICELDGRFWIAAYGLGIVGLDSMHKVRHIYSGAEGLSNLGLYKVLRLNDSMLVASSNNGLAVLNIMSGKITNYFSEDGLHANNFEETSGCDNDRYIFLGGIKGFTRMEKAAFRIERRIAPIYISSIQLFSGSKEDEYFNPSIKSIRIANQILRTVVNFTCPDYNSPQKILFQYRVTELETDWSSLGTQRFVSLIGIPPGTYTLQVRAANEAGDFGEPITLTLIYLPKWYQTWWFKALLVLAAGGIVYTYYRMRINYLLKQQQIRKEVASDLHDDIGSSLNSVKVFAHLALANPGKADYVRQIEGNLQQAITGLRDMIWILDDKLDSVEDLCNRLEQLAAKPAEAMGITVDFVMEDGLQYRNLSKPVKRNLFLIAKEAINNSVKYAGCRHIRVLFRLQQKKLVMIVQDDGKGFDTSATESGYGLSNMKGRADQIRYDCTIRSDGSGTVIRVAER